MPEILKLDDLYVTHLSVHWHEQKPPVSGTIEIKNQFTIDYDVLKASDDNRRFAMKFRYHLLGENGGKKIGYEIMSEIMGMFSFPESMPEEEMQKLVRFNGTVMLYGILRGEIAAFTGSFPGGKFILPAVYMPDIVVKIENEKRAAAGIIAEKPSTKEKRKSKKP